MLSTDIFRRILCSFPPILPFSFSVCQSDTLGLGIKLFLRGVDGEGAESKNKADNQTWRVCLRRFRRINQLRSLVEVIKDIKPPIFSPKSRKKAFNTEEGIAYK